MHQQLLIPQEVKRRRPVVPARYRLHDSPGALSASPGVRFTKWKKTAMRGGGWIPVARGRRAGSSRSYRFPLPLVR